MPGFDNMLGVGQTAWPQAQPFRPFTGLEGVPNLFGDHAPGQLAQLMVQNLISQEMTSLGLAPMGLRDTNLYDRMQQRRFTDQHNRLVQDMAAMDRAQHIGIAKGIAAATGTPWGAEQQSAANFLASGLTSLAPMLTQMAPEFLDMLGGERGSMAVMSHYMSMAGRHRLDPVTGNVGLKGEALKEVIKGVHDELFAGDRYKTAPFTMGQAGQLYQEMTMRGMAPGAASLEIMQQTSPERLQDLLSLANIKPVDVNGKKRTLEDLTADEVDRLDRVPEVRTELKNFDAKRLGSTLKEWGKSIEAMREIFGDAGYPNAPLPQLLQALTQLTGSGLSQLRPNQITEIVRSMHELAKQSGIGLQAASMMTQQAVGDALELGLNPVFGVRAAQHNMAFIGAYQALGAGEHSAWGRGDMLAHQQKNQELVLQAAASQTANQIGVASRLQDMAEFAPGSDAANFLEAIGRGQMEFTRDAGLPTERKEQIDLREEAFVDMLARGTGGKVSRDQIRMMLQERNANQEAIFHRPEALTAVRALQGQEFIERMSPVGTRALQGFMRDKFADILDTAGMDKLTETLGVDTLTSFMKSKSVVAMDPEQRRVALGNVLSRRLDDLAAAGDMNAQNMIGRFADDKEKTAYLRRAADSMFQAMDQELIATGRPSLVNQHTLHSPGLLRQQSIMQTRAQVKTAMKEALAPLGRGSMVQRMVQAIMEIEPGDERPIMDVLARAGGGEKMQEIAKHLDLNAKGDSRLSQIRRLDKEIDQAMKQIDNAKDPAEQRQALDIFQTRKKELETLTTELGKEATARGYLDRGDVQAKDFETPIRHSQYTRQQMEQLTAISQDADLIKVRDDLIAKKVLKPGVDTLDVLDLKEMDLRRAGLSDERLEQVAALKTQAAQAQKALRTDMRLGDSLAYRLGQDDATMQQLGLPGVKGARKLHDLQKQMTALAVAEHDGDLSAAYRSEKGLQIQRDRQETMAELHTLRKDTQQHHAYLEDDATSDTVRTSLRDIAKRLSDKEIISGAGLDNLLNQTPEDILDWHKRGLITDGERDMLQFAQAKHGDVMREQEKLQAEQQESAMTALEAWHDAVVGPEGDFEAFLANPEGEGQKLLKQATGESVEAQRARAALETGAKEILAVREADETGRYTPETEQWRRKHGIALEAFEDPTSDTGNADALPEAARLASQQINRVNRAQDQDSQAKESGGERRLSFAKLVIHNSGGGELTYTDGAP